MTLTPRNLDVLETLTRRVRLLSLQQVARIWWPDGHSTAGAIRRCDSLSADGWIERHVINAHPQLAIRPLSVWNPGEDEPEFAVLSQLCRTRWSLAAVPTPVIVATPRAANLFGSTSRGLPAVEHRNHDLRLAQVYVHYRRQQPRLAAQWLGEHALPKAGYRLKDPDAFLVDTAGRVRRVIESAGRYDIEQLESFHEHCVESDLPYELW